MFSCEEPVAVELAAEQQVRLSSDPPAADFIRIQSLEVDMDIPSAVVQAGGRAHEKIRIIMTNAFSAAVSLVFLREVPWLPVLIIDAEVESRASFHM